MGRLLTALVLVLDEEGGGVIFVHQLEADGASVHAHEDDCLGLKVSPGITHCQG